MFNMLTVIFGDTHYFTSDFHIVQLSLIFLHYFNDSRHYLFIIIIRETDAQ